MKKPRAVTVIAWLIIAKGTYLLLPTLLCFVPQVREQTFAQLEAQGYSPTVSVVWALIGASVRFTVSFGLLRGLRWGAFSVLPMCPARSC